MIDSLLLSLPAELRNNIFEMALTQFHAVTVGEQKRKYQFDRLTIDLLCRSQALTRTCRQIYKECGVLFYTCNDFILNLSPFFAYTVVTKRFISKFASVTSARELPRSLTVNLPQPQEIFHEHHDSNQDSELIPRINKPWNCFLVLSYNLSCFHSQHRDVPTKLHVPINLDNWGRLAYVVQLDYEVVDFCLDRAVEDMRHMVVQPHPGRRDFQTVSVMVERWRRAGFVREIGYDENYLSEGDEEDQSELDWGDESEDTSEGGSIRDEGAIDGETTEGLNRLLIGLTLVPFSKPNVRS